MVHGISQWVTVSLIISMLSHKVVHVSSPEITLLQLFLGDRWGTTFRLGGQMRYTWIQTKFEGIRYREHATRLYGIRKDRYYVIRYRVGGVRKEEPVGWESQNDARDKDGARIPLLEVARATLARLKEAHREGCGPTTLEEQREEHRTEKLREQARIEAEVKENITFTEAASLFLAWGKSNKKDHDHDQTRLDLHVLPVIGAKRMKDISASDIEAVKVAVQEKGRSAATVKHCLQCIRAVYNHAARMGRYVGENPTRNVRFPKLDNARIRFFTEEQADQLLGALWERSIDVHDMALLSLLTGLRFSEVARLRWEFVNQDHGVLNIVDTKSGSSRQAYIDNEELAEMFQRRRESAMGGLVFPGPIHGGVMKDCPDVFVKTVNGLGFNDGITDTRQRLTFHSLRHTFASWLALRGTPVFTLKELMGHKTIEMTMRYSHLMPDQKRAAVVGLAGRTKAKVIPLRQAR